MDYGVKSHMSNDEHNFNTQASLVIIIFYFLFLLHFFFQCMCMHNSILNIKLKSQRVLLKIMWHEINKKIILFDILSIE